MSKHTNTLVRSLADCFILNYVLRLSLFCTVFAFSHLLPPRDHGVAVSLVVAMLHRHRTCTPQPVPHSLRSHVVRQINVTNNEYEKIKCLKIVLELKWYVVMEPLASTNTFPLRRCGTANANWPSMVTDEVYYVFVRPTNAEWNGMRQRFGTCA